MALGDNFHVAIEGTGPAGQQLINNMYYEQTGVDGGDEGTGLIDALYAAVSEEMGALLSNLCAWTKVHTRNMSQPEFGLDYTLPSPVVGDVTGNCLPPQCAAVIQFRTGLIGKKNRGRNFLWPTGVEMQNAGQWTPTYLGLAVAYGNALKEIGSGTTTYRLIVLAHDAPPLPPIAVPVLDVPVDILVRTQRRRVLGVGQ